MDESHQNERRKARQEYRIKRGERKLLKLQRKLHMQQTGVEDISGRSSRRSSTTISDGAASQSGLIISRRHSVDDVAPPASSLGVDTFKRSFHSHSDKSQEALESPGRLLRGSRKTEPIRGILSRLSRPKQAASGGRPLPSVTSHGKELNKLSKSLEKKNATPMKQSASVPNLMSLDSKVNEFAIDFNIHEADNESQSDHSNNGEGLFL